MSPQDCSDCVSVQTSPLLSCAGVFTCDRDAVSLQSFGVSFESGQIGMEAGVASFSGGEAAEREGSLSARTCL